MVRVRAQPVVEELSERPFFSNPDCLLISSTMLFPTELKSQDTTTRGDWNYGTKTLRKVGKDTGYFLPNT